MFQASVSLSFAFAWFWPFAFLPFRVDSASAASVLVLFRYFFPCAFPVFVPLLMHPDCGCLHLRACAHSEQVCVIVCVCETSKQMYEYNSEEALGTRCQKLQQIGSACRNVVSFCMQWPPATFVPNCRGKKNIMMSSYRIVLLCMHVGISS